MPELCVLSRHRVESGAFAEVSVHGPKEGFGVVRGREDLAFEGARADWKAVVVDWHDGVALWAGTIARYELLAALRISFLKRSGNVGLQIDGDVMETSAEVLITKKRIISLCRVEDFDLVAV